jgi:tetratricopeptide (TPR) repeat protein
MDLKAGTARGDALVREGRYQSALEGYRSLLGDIESSREATVLYRVALCYEQIGKLDDALKRYRQVARILPESVLFTACQVCEARTYIRQGRLLEAKTLLWDVFLKSGEPGLRNHPLVGEALYSLGCLLATEAIPSEPFLVPTTTKRPAILADWSLEPCLGWIAPSAEGASHIADSLPDQPKIRRVGPRFDDLLCSLSSRDASVRDCVARLASSAGLHLKWSERAQLRAEARKITIVLEEARLAEVFSAVADLVGLVWKVTGTDLSFVGDEEPTVDELSSYRADLAKRVLREAIQSFPRNSVSPPGFLELGNLEFSAGNLAEACGWYERLIREAPQSSTKLDAYYNLGIARRRLNQRTAARQAFYRVVDERRGHELEALAYLQIARAHLEDYEFDQAIRPARRSISAGIGTPAQPLAALTLAASYLLTKNPRAANTALLDSRAQLLEPRYRVTTSFLDALARYRCAVGQRAGQREASELLSAVWAARRSDVLWPIGQLLMGQAYQELGLADQMAELYQDVLPKTRGPVAAEMTCTLAEYFLANDEFGRAEPLFLFLANADDPRWTPRAYLQLAELAFRQGRPKECLKWGNRLAADPAAKQFPRILHVMGQAYEKLGEYARAAKCFSGEWPMPEGKE